MTKGMIALLNHVIVRQATIEDLEEIAHLFNEYRVFYQQESCIDKAKSFLFDRLEHRESIIFIAQESVSNRFVGFTQLYPFFSSLAPNTIFVI